MTGKDKASDELLLEARGDVRIVTLNRPEALNAADEVLHGKLAEVWKTLADDDDVRAIVVTGAGRAFCGGGDLNLLERMTNDVDLRARIMEEASEIVRFMTAIKAPIVAAINGPAVGLGCSIASMSDLVLIEEDAYFADPHVALGLVAADGGALTWPLLTSLQRAKEYLLLGDRVGASDAVAFGLANRVVPKGEALSSAIELAERIAKLPPQAVQETKRLLNLTLRTAVEVALPQAIASEIESFDQPEFRANLERMLARSRS